MLIWGNKTWFDFSVFSWEKELLKKTITAKKRKLILSWIKNLLTVNKTELKFRRFLFSASNLEDVKTKLLIYIECCN